MTASLFSKHFERLLLILLLASPSCAARGHSRDSLFESKILPIFKETCFQCHGALKTSGFDLRSHSGLIRGGKRGTDVVPGQADQSRLYRFVAGIEKPQMPPARKLGTEQIAAIRAWIDSGAKWPANKAVDSRPWPFNSPVRPVVPNVKDSAWIRNP